jgi:hypothetical protein
MDELALPPFLEEAIRRAEVTGPPRVKPEPKVVPARLGNLDYLYAERKLEDRGGAVGSSPVS